MSHHRNSLPRRLGTALIALAVSAPYVAPATAAMIGTDQVIRAEQTRIDRDRLLKALEGKAVQEQLVALGVDPKSAHERVLRLTDEEIAALNERMKDMPAGSGALAALAAVFIILVITDALGYTDVFTFVRPR